MKTRRVGDLTLSVVGLGTNNFGRNVDLETSVRVVRTAIDAGATFIDTADKYGGTLSEQHLGRALEGRRDEVVLATKFGMPVDDDSRHAGTSRRWVMEAIDASLRRLRTDYVDLYQIHMPDPTTPIEETLEALADLRAVGKIRAAGCSNFSADQLREATDAAGAGEHHEPLQVAQSEYSLLNREVEDTGVLAFCVGHGIGFTPYYPLASGLLTGKYRPDQAPPAGTRFATVDRYQPMWNERNLGLASRLNEYARSRGRRPIELAISWLLARPGVTSVLCGATRPEQVVANAEATTWRLSPEELAEVDAITTEPATHAGQARP